MALHHDLGDWGDEAADAGGLNLATGQDDPLALFAVLDVYWKTRHEGYLALARAIGNNVCRTRFAPAGKGRLFTCFMADTSQVYASIDTIEPYALLALHAAIAGRQHAVPSFIHGAGYTEGEFRLANGKSAVMQDRVIRERQVVNGSCRT